MLLHVTCLRRDGYQTAYEGARGYLRGAPAPQGSASFPDRVDGRQHCGASGPDAAATHPHVTVTPTAVSSALRSNGSTACVALVSLLAERALPDIFVHMRTLARYGIAELRPGQTVLVRFGPGPKGLMAAEVRPDGGPLGLASH